MNCIIADSGSLIALARLNLLHLPAFLYDQALVWREESVLTQGQWLMRLYKVIWWLRLPEPYLQNWPSDIWSW